MLIHSRRASMEPSSSQRLRDLGSPRDTEPSGATSSYTKRQVCLWAPLANACLSNQPQGVSAHLTSVRFTCACLGRTPGTLGGHLYFWKQNWSIAGKSSVCLHFQKPNSDLTMGHLRLPPKAAPGVQAPGPPLPPSFSGDGPLFPEDLSLQNRSQRPESEVQLHHSHVVWPWANYRTSSSSVSSSEKWTQDHASFKEMDFECSSIRLSTSWVLTVWAPWYRGKGAVLINHTLQKKRKALICGLCQMLCSKHAHHHPLQATDGLTGWQDSCIFNNRLLGSHELLYSICPGRTHWILIFMGSWFDGENQEQFLQWFNIFLSHL